MNYSVLNLRKINILLGLVVVLLALVAVCLPHLSHAQRREPTQRKLYTHATAGHFSDVGTNSHNLLLYSQSRAIQNATPCTTCNHFTGRLDAPYLQSFEPNGTYFWSNGIGYLNGSLRGPAGADFDLYLWAWMGTSWMVVAKAEGPTANENISYFGVPGYYTWRIYSYSGSGAYTFDMTHP